MGVEVAGVEAVEALAEIEAAVASAGETQITNKLEVQCEAPKVGLEAVLAIATAAEISEALEVKVMEEEVKDTNLTKENLCILKKLWLIALSNK